METEADFAAVFFTGAAGVPTLFFATAPFATGLAGAFPAGAALVGAALATFGLAAAVAAFAGFPTGFPATALGPAAVPDFFAGTAEAFTAEALTAGFEDSVLFDFALTAALPAGDFPFAFGCMLRPAF